MAEWTISSASRQRNNAATGTGCSGVLQRVVASGGNTFEQYGLALARLCGLGTGGRTVIPRNGAQICRRDVYGLTADASDYRQAVLDNIRSADAVLVLGRPDPPVLRAVYQKRRFLFLNFWNGISRSRLRHWLAGVRTLCIVGGKVDHGTNRLLVHRLGEVFAMVSEGLGRYAEPLNLPDLSGVACAVPGRILLTMGFDGGIVACVPWPVTTVCRLNIETGCWQMSNEWPGYEWTAGIIFGVANATRFWNQVPPWLAAELRPMGEIGLRLLTVISRLLPGGIDLALARRWGILYLLTAKHIGNRDLTWKRRGEIIRMRQRDILALAGFPRTQGTVRAMGKLLLPSLANGALPLLHTALGQPYTIHAIAHLPHLTTTALRVLANPRLATLVGPGFLERLAEDVAADRNLGEARGGSKFQTLIDHADALNAWREIKTMHTESDLQRAVRRLKEIAAVGWRTQQLLPPDVPDLIEKLEPGGPLELEGLLMGHCAETYDSDVQAGIRGIYRVLPDPTFGTERATFMLQPNVAGSWKIAEVRGPRNSAVGQHTQTVIEAWLHIAASHGTPQHDSILEMLRVALHLPTSLPPAHLGAMPGQNGVAA